MLNAFPQSPDELVTCSQLHDFWIDELFLTPFSETRVLKQVTMAVPSTPSGSKLGRPAPFTPRRPLSMASTSSTSSTDLTARIARTNSNSSLLSSTHKKYKAPLSVESRSKNFSKTKTVLAPVPGTPTKKEGTTSRPRTPVTPRRADSPSLLPAASEMDVSNVDPEQVLVDYQSVEPGDVSGEIDEAWLRAAELDHGKEDKVMVSIRYVQNFFIMLAVAQRGLVEYVPQNQLLRGYPLLVPTPSNSTPHMPRTPHQATQPPPSTLTPSSPALRTNQSIQQSPGHMYKPPWKATTPSSSRTDKQRLERPSL